jgi:hypothetical protein
MSSLSQLVYEYEQLQEKLKNLCRLRHKLDNLHMYQLKVDDICVNGADHSLTREAKAALVESVMIPIRQAEADLRALESRIR